MAALDVDVATMRARLASRGESVAERTLRAYLAGERRPGHRRALAILDALDVRRQERLDVLELLAADEGAA